MKTSRASLIWLVPSLLATVAAWPFLRVQQQIFPGPMGNSYTYSDSSEGGGSWSRLEMDGKILRSIQHLDTGCPNPYAGFGWWLTDADHPNGQDWRRFDRMELELRSPALLNLGYNVITWIPGFTEIDKPMTAMFHEAATPVSPIFSKVEIPLSNLHVAVWWPQVAGVGANSAPDRIDMVKNFEIRMPPALRPVRTDTVEIRSIQLVGTRWTLLVAAIAVGFCLSFAWWSILRRRELRLFEVSTLDLEPKPPPPEIASPHRPVLDAEPARLELPNRRDIELHALLTWINANYHKENLGVEDAAKGSGVGIRRIPQLLKEHSGKSFPAYVASLRIAQARRLLKETDRQVSEIAMAVGFSNSSHFHRVFKAETGESPSSWREKANDSGS